MPTRGEIKSYFDAAGKRPQAGQFAALVDAIPMVDGSTGEIEYFDEQTQQFVKAQFGGLAVRVHTQNIDPADMLTGNTAPIAVPIARAAGETVTPLFPILGSVVFNSSAFATNTVIGLRYVGADEPIATCDLLGRTASGTVNFVPVTSVAAGDTQYLLDTDLEIYVLSGDPTAGDSVSAVSFPYMKS